MKRFYFFAYDIDYGSIIIYNDRNRKISPSGLYTKESGKMKKTDPTVKKETIYIAVWTIILSVFIHSVFLILKKWDLTVLYGNLFGIFIAVLNFFLMGRTVQSALGKDEKDAKNTMKLSQSLRYLMIIAAVAVSAVIKCFNIFAVVIPLLFPRIAISFRPLFDKKDDKKEE